MFSAQDAAVAELAREENVADPGRPAHQERPVETEAAFFRLDVVDRDALDPGCS